MTSNDGLRQNELADRQWATAAAAGGQLTESCTVATRHDPPLRMLCSFSATFCCICSMIATVVRRVDAQPREQWSVPRGRHGERRFPVSRFRVSVNGERGRERERKGRRGKGKGAGRARGTINSDSARVLSAAARRPPLLDCPCFPLLPDRQPTVTRLHSAQRPNHPRPHPPPPLTPTAPHRSDPIRSDPLPSPRAAAMSAAEESYDDQFE